MKFAAAVLTALGLVAAATAPASACPAHDHEKKAEVTPPTVGS